MNNKKRNKMMKKLKKRGVKFNHKKSVIIPSSSSIKEEKQINKNSITELLKNYVELPFLPIGKHININKIGVYNYDFAKNIHGGSIKYSMLTVIDGKNYPVGVNPQLDYMPEEQVSPVVIIDTDGKRYRTNDLHWFPLTDIANNIMKKQAITGIRVLPCLVKIDDKINKDGIPTNTWISKLMNISR